MNTYEVTITPTIESYATNSATTGLKLEQMMEHAQNIVNRHSQETPIVVVHDYEFAGILAWSFDNVTLVTQKNIGPAVEISRSNELAENSKACGFGFKVLNIEKAKLKVKKNSQPIVFVPATICVSKETTYPLASLQASVMIHNKKMAKRG